MPARLTLVHVAEQEADMYDLSLAAQATPQTELLVRERGAAGRLRDGWGAGTP